MNFDEETDKKMRILNEEVSRILKQLGIKANAHLRSEKIEIGQKLLDYVVRNSKYDETIIQEKRMQAESGITPYQLEILDIYRCLCEHRSVCSSDAGALSLLLRRAGLQSEHILIEKNNGTFHDVATVQIEGKILYCDPTLTREGLAKGQITDSKTLFGLEKKDFMTLYPKSKKVLSYGRF